MLYRIVYPLLYSDIKNVSKKNYKFLYGKFRSQEHYLTRNELL
jgi:hypothetical protein